MNVEEKNAKLILAKLHLICKRKFRNFNFEFRIFNYGSYSLSFISHVIQFYTMGHSQSSIPHFSKI